MVKTALDLQYYLASGSTAIDLLQSKIDILQIEHLIHRSWYMILLKQANT